MNNFLYPKSIEQVEYTFYTSNTVNNLIVKVLIDSNKSLVVISLEIMKNKPEILIVIIYTIKGITRDT